MEEIKNIPEESDENNENNENNDNNDNIDNSNISVGKNKNNPNIEINLQHEQIIEEYLEIINKTENKLITTQLIAMVSFAVYLLFLTAFLSIDAPPNYLYTLIPSFTGVISLNASMNLYIRIIDIYSEAKNYMGSGKKVKSVSLSSIISYISINLVTFLTLGYLFSVTAKVQKIIEIELNLINIPFYIILGICLFYLLFFLPAMVKDRAIWPIVLCLTIFIAIFSFLVAFTVIFDKILVNMPYLYAFIPLFGLIAVLYIWSLYQLFNNESKEDLFAKISRLMTIFLMSGFIIITPLKLDGIIQIYNWAVMLFPITAYVLFFSERVKTLYFNEDEDNDVKPAGSYPNSEASV